MKNLLKLSLFSLLFLSFACSDDEDTLTGNKNTGGLVAEMTSSLTYKQGQPNNETMSVNFSVFQGRDEIEKVEVYKQYFGLINVGTDQEEMISSNNLLFFSFDMPLVDQYESKSYQFDYTDLIEGLTFNGGSLPLDDSTLNIGDYWKLTYVAYLTDGTTVHLNRNFTKVNVACGSYLAGNYYVNYLSGPQIHTLTEIGDGLYEMSSMFGWPTAGYKVKITDLCGTCTILNDWQFSNDIGGTGTVQPNGNITFTDVFVSDVYSGRAYTLIKI